MISKLKDNLSFMLTTVLAPLFAVIAAVPLPQPPPIRSLIAPVNPFERDADPSFIVPAIRTPVEMITTA